MGWLISSGGCNSGSFRATAGAGWVGWEWYSHQTLILFQSPPFCLQSEWGLSTLPCSIRHLWTHSDLAVGFWVSARIMGEWCSHPQNTSDEGESFLRERWWILSIIILKYLWDIQVEMTRGQLDGVMELRRCLDGTHRRRRHCRWGGDKLKSCPGSRWRQRDSDTEIPSPEVSSSIYW